jgi:hypothetical protein
VSCRVRTSAKYFGKANKLFKKQQTDKQTNKLKT